MVGSILLKALEQIAMLHGLIKETHTSDEISRAVGITVPLLTWRRFGWTSLGMANPLFQRGTGEEVLVLIHAGA